MRNFRKFIYTDCEYNQAGEEMRILSSSIIGVLLLLSILISTLSISYAEEWILESVDTSNTITRFNALDIDNNGNIHFLYKDEDTFKYVVKSNSGWERHVLDIPSNVTHFDFEIDSNGISHAAFLFGDDVIYGFGYNTINSIDTIFTESSWSYIDVAISVDRNSDPHIAFGAGDTGTDNVYYSFKDGENWTTYGIDSTSTIGEILDIAINYEGHPRIMYGNFADPAYPRIAKYNGTNWIVEPITENAMVGLPRVLADNHDNIHVFWSTFHYPTTIICHAKEAEGWTVIDSLVLEESIGDSDNWAATARGDSLFVTFLKNGPYDNINFAYNFDNNWHVETIDSVIISRGYGISLDANPEAGVHISFMGYHGEHLNHAFKDYITSVDDKNDGGDLPKGIRINSISPNPFNSQTRISYSIDKPGEVNLSVFNLLGEKIYEISQFHNNPGEFSIIWNGENLSSGIYFTKLTQGKKSQCRRMLFLK